MIPDALRFPPGGKPWLLYALLAASLSFNVGVLVAYGPGAEVPGVPPPPPIQAIGEDGLVTNPPIPPDQVPPLPSAQGVVQSAGLFGYAGIIQRSLSDTFQPAPGTNPAALTAVYSRLFIWDVDMRRDIHKGDLVEVLYEQPGNAEPLLLLARLHLRPGTPQERILSAYRFQAPGDAYTSYWDTSGQEVPRRLIDGPLVDYEQITSLLKDGRTHDGMDFKVNIGTDVLSPRAGVVTRTDWLAANGNCVEIRFSDGILAGFLHLNQTLVKPGDRVIAGSVIGKSGNTGRSTGPHLHYQLLQSSRAVDPVQYHGVLRRQLQPEAMKDYQLRISELDQQLLSRVAARPVAPEPAPAPAAP